MNRTKKMILGCILLILITLILLFIPERRNELKTQHFTFFYSTSIDKSKIETLSKTLEGNYMRIQNDLKTTAAPNIITTVYANRWQYVKATKNWGGSGSIEGINKLHFMEHAWDEADSKKVTLHEFTHTVTLKLLLDIEKQPINNEVFDKKFLTFPIWLWEAISVYEAQEFINPKTLSYMNKVHYPSVTELNDRKKGGKIYSCGYTIIEYILEKYGQDKLISLIKNYGNLQTTFDSSNDQFFSEWYDFVQNRYLK
ncbi:hypothetical protein EOD40_04880 [Flavobacterium sufflavum]|uniref:Peptidase MA-like domain-containing protein n=1 Tax=Flavobacterium sufflavum TaxID=1921138 RepID=A0A437L0R8_9FLAO|nr:hypothetical protein [Flavobacterium sufflavum]RVT78571.1 hypothetical protein EOD40_04880 [Flavobacterium sufflavum]